MAFRNAGINLTNTMQTVYTGPVGYETVVHSIYIANKDAVNTISVSVQVVMQDNGATGTSGTFYAAYGITIPAGTSLILDKPLTLRPGDLLQAMYEGGTGADIIANYLITAEDATAPR